ncbi:MAG: phospho-N-acetylmuramoyl-pentapeptide-transferase [Roseibacillus sp.]|jgi:phospho-N-acetylmuramoyl-pentapeptide-transferase|nr:phospho-N-acetylmuramoyl-pentapeptide-transferase [Roseibacillus sp.]MBP35516.1 phospho-N-acetylmuramoyl-pentapeptide-transferase [Roseibacillus sp.]MCP4731625.1 phospho-N-acetylmuramoyl-pentapeptide-transferase [Roseibacillus sp.]MDP7308037.1 phospho-N-acetylmuramoyl-pentapeptide-transferase [Roseibacillus sp.]HJM63783.1 phospho-N-acetylmuramoyl-pentapeptide-transferase [Roseibacillus sp.]|tara:strand:- start:8973 stop:10220 length:1248 start_codon:yes stop_codon:yes gene_type:complete
MFYWLYEQWEQARASGAGWADPFSFLNILQYITVRAGLATILSFLFILISGPRVIRKLISLKVGQPIRSAEEVHKLAELHGDKAGTPTMGGVLILGAVLLAVLLCGRALNPFVAVTCCVMLALGLLGFMDDYNKVVRKNSEGISARQKLFWQFVIGGLAACFLFFKPEVSGFGLSDSKVMEERQGYFLEVSDGVGTDAGGGVSEPVVQHFKVSEISFPLMRKPFLSLSWLAIPFFMIIITGCSNAVNLTDGLDGLATGCTITVSLAYAVIAYLAGRLIGLEYLHIPFHPLLGELTVVLMALVGAGMGFLWWNCHPAKVFMGDTGSLAIGGALATAAICIKQELLLVIIGGVFVAEALSVILQVGSFKLRGKRIFAMAPVHHHFELRGWHESQVITRFWIISIVLAMAGLGLLKII